MSHQNDCHRHVLAVSVLLNSVFYFEIFDIFCVSGFVHVCVTIIGL